MPLFHIMWNPGQSRETKERIRTEIGQSMGRLAGIDPSFIAVLFADLKRGDMGAHGALTEVFISEGRPDSFKDQVVALATDAICGHTGWAREEIGVIIHDLRKGSIAVNGKIVNRAGPAADAVIKEKKEKPS